ncbi:zinc ribbon domain-containing protein [Streptomyces sp. NPDC050856]|uniref:zinc ribbon domain-containing protein n=1 Tax=Streptomyces sp. NPDC050856 TaxID=3154939 RepID=UPI0033E3FB84
MTTAPLDRQQSRCRLAQMLVGILLLLAGNTYAGAAWAADPAGDPSPPPATEDHPMPPGLPDPDQRTEPLPHESPGDPARSPAPHTPGGHATMRADRIPPQDYAADAVARVEVAAHVDVAVHWDTMRQYHFKSVIDTTAGGTGVFVNPSGVLVTSAESVVLDRERVTVYAVNQAWHRAEGVPLPDNPYERVRLPDDPELDAAVNSCYQPDNPKADCAVFITPEIRVHPYTAAEKPKALKATVMSTLGGVAVLSAAAPGKTATIALAPDQRGEKPWTSVGWPTTPSRTTGPATAQGRYDRQGAVAEQDIGKLREQLGTGLPGSVLVDEHGALTGMLNPTGNRVDVLPPARITAALDRSGVQAERGPGDSSKANGLALYAKHEYRHAAPWLHSAADDTGQGAMAVRYHKAAHANTDKPNDMSDEADAHTGHAASGGGTNWALVGPLIGLTVLAAAGAALFVRKRRRPALAGGPDMDGPGPDRDANASVATWPGRPPAAQHPPRTEPAAPPPSDQRDGQVTDRAERREEDADSPRAPQSAFCASCGALLSPGDRFCFSCGAASHGS